MRTENASSIEYLPYVRDYVNQKIGEDVEINISINAEDLKLYLAKCNLVITTIDNRLGMGTIDANLRVLSVAGNGAISGKGFWHYDGIRLRPTEKFLNYYSIK